MCACDSTSPAPDRPLRIQGQVLEAGQAPVPPLDVDIQAWPALGSDGSDTATLRTDAAGLYATELGPFPNPLVDSLRVEYYGSPTPLKQLAQISTPDPTQIVIRPFDQSCLKDVEKAIRVSAFGGFLVAQQAVRRMLPKGEGAILLTGASASVKGYAQSAPFAMGKFALRGLAQSMARELSPRGIHVAHFVIDGGIRSERRAPQSDKPDALLDPDAIAQTYLHVLQQQRSAWTWEVELRPWVENF